MNLADRIMATLFFSFIYAFCTAYLSYPLFFLVWRWWAKRRGRMQPRFISLAVWLGVLGMGVMSIHNFLTFNEKAYKSEAKTNLHAIYTSQQAYHLSYGTFVGGPGAFYVLNWGPSGQTAYSYFCGDDVITNTRNTIQTARPGPDWPFKRSPASSASAFTCVAVGNIDNDVYQDVWSVDDSGNLHQVMDDVGNFKEGEWDPNNNRAIFVIFTGLVMTGALVAERARSSRDRKAKGRAG